MLTINELQPNTDYRYIGAKGVGHCMVDVGDVLRYRPFIDKRVVYGQIPFEIIVGRNKGSIVGLLALDAIQEVK